MSNGSRVIYTSQLDPTFCVSVKKGSKSAKDFVVKSKPWPLAQRPPTHLDWVSLLLKQPQSFALEVVEILIDAAKLSFKNDPIDVLATNMLPPASKSALARWENSSLKGKEGFLRDEDGVLVPVDGFIIAVTLIFVQEVNNYGERAWLPCILTHHVKQFLLQKDKETLEQIIMLADTKTWRSRKRSEALELREKLALRYTCHSTKP